MSPAGASSLAGVLSTEKRLVEDPAIELMARLGWKTIDLYSEQLGPKNPTPTSSFFCLISDEPSSPVRLIHCNCLGYHGRIGGTSNIVTNGRQFSVDILML